MPRIAPSWQKEDTNVMGKPLILQNETFGLPFQRERAQIGGLTKIHFFKPFRRNTSDQTNSRMDSGEVNEQLACYAIRIADATPPAPATHITKATHKLNLSLGRPDCMHCTAWLAAAVASWHYNTSTTRRVTHPLLRGAYRKYG